MNSEQDRARRTAAEIARKKVLAAYSGLASNGSSPSTGSGSGFGGASSGAVFYQTDRKPQTRIEITEDTPATSNAAPAPDWRKYHSAWQNYYQKYYADYYSKAAQDYIEGQKAREAKAAAEGLPQGASGVLTATKSGPDRTFGTPVKGVVPQVSETIASRPEPKSGPARETSVSTKKEIAEKLKATVQRRASERSQKSRRFKKFMPIIAGATVVLLLLFLQYNRLIFAPLAAYVSPASEIDTSITAIDPSISAAVGDQERLIIPKLNIDVPILFGVSNDSDSTMEAMNHGVVHWAIPGASALPGQIGNMVITGHSAGDIYSSNQYKFIFSGLERLAENDLIYIDYGGVRYTYSVSRLETVEPTEVSKLVYETDKPMLTLITCTPLGTSRYRLLVTAEQISPAPSGETQEENGDSDSGDFELVGDTTMVGNSPTFFESIWNFLTGK